jgi:hypothetical protein
MPFVIQVFVIILTLGNGAKDAVSSCCDSGAQSDGRLVPRFTLRCNKSRKYQLKATLSCWKLNIRFFY